MLIYSSVIWTKSNPQPWQNIKPGETTKMLNVTQDAKRCVKSFNVDYPRLTTDTAGLAVASRSWKDGQTFISL